MNARSLAWSSIAIVGMAGAVLIAVWPGASRDPEEGGGAIRIVRADGEAVSGPQPDAATPAEASPVSSEPTPASMTPPTRRHYGAPVILADSLLDPVLGRAPEDIQVRHRLMAMQLAAGRDSLAEERMAAQLARLWGADGRGLRVRCTISLCEVAAPLPKLAARLAGDAAAFVPPEEAACAASEASPAMPVWSNGQVALRFVPRTSC